MIMLSMFISTDISDAVAAYCTEWYGNVCY